MVRKRKVRNKVCRKCGGNLYANGCRLCPMFAASKAAGGQQPSGWPMTSQALAVHPSQVAEANERNRRHGLGTRYDPATGNAIIPDRTDRKRLLRLEGFHDKSGGYGD